MIRLVLEGIRPISINEAYTPVRNKMLKTERCRFFENEVRLRIMPQVQGDWCISENIPHRLTLDVYLPDLINKGWPKSTKQRFKRRDTSNMVKVLEDIVASIFGVDDCCFVEHVIRKRHGPLRTVVTIEPLPEDE